MSISVLIFTLNEELHLPRCIESVRWSDDVIVVDSFSTDRTAEICASLGARMVQRPFSAMWEQRNWALRNAGAKHDWALILDADEWVPPMLAAELQAVPHDGNDKVAAYRVRRRFHMWGRWLRFSSLYPTWLVRLVRRDRVAYFSQGHGEGQEVSGRIGDLQNDLIDENLRGIDEWFLRQNAYSSRDAVYELEAEKRHMNATAILSRDPAERRRALKQLAMRLPFRALAYFLYSYVFRLGFLDGRDGLVFCIMKAVYQQMVVIKKYDHKRR
jgi:glycosyltransferase involved in cell wall biosynthesis